MFSELKYPIIQAPMAGGISTPQLVIAVAKCGGLGFLAGGYKTAPQLEQQIQQCIDANISFGVNLFVPTNDAITSDTMDYYERLQKDFQHELPLIASSDDYFEQKLELCYTYKIRYVSFTFGTIERPIVQKLQQNGAYVIFNCTNSTDAFTALSYGVDAICIQGHIAGGHQAELCHPPTVHDETLEQTLQIVQKHTSIPLIVAGGIMNHFDVQKYLHLGAAAVQVGTAFICTDESGAPAAYKQAFLANEFTETRFTYAFTGRKARGIVNDFMRQYDSFAPPIYPAVHAMTKPIRDNAAQNLDAQHMSLWANTRFKEVTCGSVQNVFQTLVKNIRK